MSFAQAPCSDFFGWSLISQKPLHQSSSNFLHTFVMCSVREGTIMECIWCKMAKIERVMRFWRFQFVTNSVGQFMANKIYDNFLYKCHNQMAISKFWKCFVLAWKYEVEIWTNYAIFSHLKSKFNFSGCRRDFKISFGVLYKTLLGKHKQTWFQFLPKLISF